VTYQSSTPITVPRPRLEAAHDQAADVCYVRLGTRDLEGATRFATDILGLEVSEWGKGSRHFKSDAREHTLCYVDGDPSIQVAGFEVSHRDDLEQAASELEKLGHAVHVGTREEADARMVREFIGFCDPTGNRIEIAWRPAVSGIRYQGTRDTGITGFSHIGLCTTDPVRDEAFWTQVCNARVSDRIGDAALLRIDEVHHSIALFPTDRGASSLAVGRGGLSGQHAAMFTPYVPHSEVLAKSRLVISHAGHGIAMKALYYGVPMVLVPWGRDQPGVAARAEALGVATVVRRDACNDASVAKAVCRILDDVRDTERANTISKRLQEEDAVKVACTRVESFSDRPVPKSIR